MFRHSVQRNWIADHALYESKEEKNTLLTQFESLFQVEYPVSIKTRESIQNESNHVKELKQYSITDKFKQVAMDKCTFLSNVSKSILPNTCFLFYITDHDYQIGNITYNYSYLPMAKARRHDVKRSIYKVWSEEKEHIIKSAYYSYLHYTGLNLYSQPLPIQEDECCWRLREYKEWYGPALFPCSLAISLIKRYEAKKIIDISAGWGDRLLASCLNDCEYWGCDPNPDNTQAYQSIISKFGDPLKQSVLCCPFENATSYPHCRDFDFLLTSPPFFNLEVYNETDPNQSVTMYKNVDEWLSKFLFRSLSICDSMLKVGAHACIHFSDITYFTACKESIKLVHPMIHYCLEVLKWRLVEVVGYIRESPTLRNRKMMKLTNKKKVHVSSDNCLYKFDGRTDDSTRKSNPTYHIQPIWIFKK